MNSNEFKTLAHNPTVAGAGVIAIALVIVALIGSWTLYTIRGFDNSISVTGSTKVSVKADSVKWTSNISRTVTEAGLSGGYAQIAKDSAAVQAFFTKQGIDPKNVTVSPVFSDQVYSYNNNGGPREYSVRQTFTVQSASSSDIEKITNLTKATQQITAQGIIFSGNQPEYYYSGLAKLRVNLLADAIKDAKARAQELAKSSGSRVGALKSASTGVVQVLAPNSVEVSDYGQYDTQSIDKDVMVTVRASFTIK